jgi:hypothetical protein
MSMAATIGPTPKISCSVVPDAATALAILALESRRTVSRWSISATQFKGQAMALEGRDADRSDAVEQAAGLVDDDFLADPTGCELGHQRVQPAAQLVPPASQIGVMLDQ